MSRDPRIDAYIARAAPFAQPILEHLRAAVHAHCPDVEETLKWSMPHFVHGGEIVCNMAAFKAHVAFGFWKGELVTGQMPQHRQAMGQFGRLASVADLPDAATLGELIAKAVELIDAGVKKPRPLKHPKPAAELPGDLSEALACNAAARATFEAFPPGQRREYIDWINEAKRAETRARRIAQAVEWLAEGKRRNWKYEAGC